VIFAQLTVWVVVIAGPTGFAPVHHFNPVLWSTQTKCEAEIDHLLQTHEIEIMDSEYSLQCLAIPDLSGEPA
jgi:hypothetical protein